MFLVVKGGVVANPGTAIGIASAKTSLTFTEAFARGIMCNWLVCMAGGLLKPFQKCEYRHVQQAKGTPPIEQILQILYHV